MSKIATCGNCRKFKVPWGEPWDEAGKAAMLEHVQECKRATCPGEAGCAKAECRAAGCVLEPIRGGYDMNVMEEAEQYVAADALNTISYQSEAVRIIEALLVELRAAHRYKEQVQRLFVVHPRPRGTKPSSKR